MTKDPGCLALLLPRGGSVGSAPSNARGALPPAEKRQHKRKDAASERPRLHMPGCSA